jgi:hypothetical protein
MQCVASRAMEKDELMDSRYTLHAAVVLLRVMSMFVELPLVLMCGIAAWLRTSGYDAIDSCLPTSNIIDARFDTNDVRPLMSPILVMHLSSVILLFNARNSPHRLRETII